MRPLLTLLVLAGPTAGTARPQDPPLTLTYLGNMGVLLERGGRKAVIDGLHRGGLPEYAAVPPRLLGPLETNREPFAGITLALTTHRHADHFDARSVAARLAADSGVVYAAAAETVDTLLARSAAAPGDPRIRAIEPGPQRAIPLAGALDWATVIDLPHNATRRSVANVGFLLDFAGIRVLHVGDADPTMAIYGPLRLAASGVDVAIVPFWYLIGEDDAVRRSIGARVWVASHIPLADTASVRRQVLDRVPGAIVLAAPGQHHTIR
ncbi:MAG: MBL fold metallo-hydrolase [Gemmatimonadales bacterium]